MHPSYGARTRAEEKSIPFRVALLSLLMLTACASSGSSPSLASAPATGAATASVTASPTVSTRDARIARLKRSFDCTDESASGAGVCTLKDGIGGSLVRKRIEPVVISTGAIHLRSVYRDRDWIYHDYVVVRIGDAVLRSDAMSATSPDVSRRTVRRDGRDRRGSYRDDYITEQVSYRGGRDNGIIKAIANAGSSPVVMQLTGGPRTFEKTLSDDEKRLFEEAYELARLLSDRAAAARQ
jgi:hypothetical protein